MRLLKQLLPLLFTLAFTAAAIFLPPTLSKIRDSVDFAGPIIEEAPLTEAEAKPALADSLTIIAKVHTEGSDVLESSQYFSTAPNEGLLESVKRELNALWGQVFFSEELSYYFPEFLDFTADSSYWNYSLVTCTDSSKPFHSASYWRLSWAGEDFSLEIHMETATEKIFALSIADYTGSLFSLSPNSGNDFTGFEGNEPQTSPRPPLMFFPFSPEEFFIQFGDYLALPLSAPVFDTEWSAYYAPAQGQEYSFLLQEGGAEEYPHMELILLIL